jgi:hypothetical protein
VKGKMEYICYRGIPLHLAEFYEYVLMITCMVHHLNHLCTFELCAFCSRELGPFLYDSLLVRKCQQTLLIYFFTQGIYNISL